MKTSIIVESKMVVANMCFGAVDYKDFAGRRAEREQVADADAQAEVELKYSLAEGTHSVGMHLHQAFAMVSGSCLWNRLNDLRGTETWLVVDKRQQLQWSTCRDSPSCTRSGRCEQ